MGKTNKRDSTSHGRVRVRVHDHIHILPHDRVHMDNLLRVHVHSHIPCVHGIPHALGRVKTQ